MTQKKPKRGHMITEDDDFVAVFAANVAREIEKYPKVPPKDSEALLQRQKAQIELLVECEDEARKALLRDPRGLEVYAKFAEFIQKERRNSLAAQPYFREPEKLFTEEISPALKAGHIRNLFKFHFNYAFVAHARRVVEWKPEDPFFQITERLIAARTELIEMNLPLAISRAKIFYNRTPKSHMEYLDLIQCAAEGLIAAIDKFRLPYRPVFRSVAIGRMTGIFIDRYSDTVVRFYPLERRRIYRANKAMRRHTAETVDMKALTEVVNEGMEERYKASPEEMSCLMSAVSCLSMDWQDTMSEGDEGMSFGESIAAPEDHRPDVMAEKSEQTHQLYRALGALPMLQQKIVRMTMALEAI